MICLDNADVVTMQIRSEAVELLELAGYPTVASDQPVSQEMLVHSRVGEVTAQSVVVERVIAQRCRVLVEVRICEIKVEIVLSSPRLYRTRKRFVYLRDCYSIQLDNHH